MANPLLREGPLPVLAHGVIEYLAGILFIAAPTLWSFEAPAATAVSVVVGVVVLIVAATSAVPTGLIRGIPVSVHVALDFVLAIALIATPFVFGFVDDRNALIFFLALGVLHLLVTIGTRFERLPKEGARQPTGKS